MLKDIPTPYNFEIPGKFPNEPQLLGLIDIDAREKALLDSRTTVTEVDGHIVPVIVPIEFATEANQEFFSDKKPALFVDIAELQDHTIRSDILDKFMKSVRSGTSIMLEVKEEDTSIQDEIDIASKKHQRDTHYDPDIFDKESGTMASVSHFISRLNPELPEDGHIFANMKDAYDFLNQNGLWEDFKNKGVHFVRGNEIDQELLDQLWEVYDKTFDTLVENHPSAQKQPREYFDKQTTSAGSHITYVIKDESIVSALFLIDDVIYCPWLNADYYENENPDGQTLFITGISTSLDMKGMGFSEQTIKAMAAIVERVPSLVACATQCTNRSKKYIPQLANEFTKGNVNLNLREIASYQYPVLVIN